MAEVVDERTRLVTVPTVTFSPGLLTDLAPLAEACRRHGAFFAVDAAQSIGVIDTDDVHFVVVQQPIRDSSGKRKLVDHVPV